MGRILSRFFKSVTYYFKKSEFPFLKHANEDGKIFCTICESVFSIEHGRHLDIIQHTKKVKNNLLALSAASKHD
jgi:hypothetical protein